MLSHSVFNPMSPQADAISHLFIFLLIAAGCVFAGLPLTLAYTLPKFRHRPGQGDPPPTFGAIPVEIVYTVVPILLLTVVFGVTIQTMRLSQPGADPPPGKGQTADLTVIGHQWWWEFRYRSGVVTASVLHIPVGQRWYVALKSVDVIHSFWVPQLEGKMDTVPGQTNHMWLEADRPGVYEGNCVEFCGSGHAWMRLQVIAQPKAQFDAWQRHELQPARPPTPPALQGLGVYTTYACYSCHNVGGLVPVHNTGSASTTIAPDLTHFASRPFLAGEALTNNPANVEAWLHDPNAIKPGVHMPNFQLTNTEIRELTAFLESLK